MLKKIQLRNYRSCVDTEFSLQPDLSVLVGPNGCGKTNLLIGLVLLRKLLQEGRLARHEAVPFAGESVLKAWFEVDGKTLILTAKIMLYTDESNNDVVVSSMQSWYAKDFTGSATRLKVPLSIVSLLGRRSTKQTKYEFDMNRLLDLQLGQLLTRGLDREKEEPALDAILKVGKWVGGITYYSASQFTNPAACPVSIEVDREGSAMRRSRRNVKTATRFLFDLYGAHHNGSETYEEFVGLIGPSGIGLIDELAFDEIETSSVDYSVRVGGGVSVRRLKKVLVVPQFKIGRNTLSPNQLSEGTFKTIALLFYLITRTRTLLLLEEPEVCVHHGLLGSILELMKGHSSDQQIVLSTHSDFVLDNVEPRSVYAVARNSDGETTVSSLTKAMSSKELAALRNYLETEGGLGEYWKHGALD